jgi:hypothetical protein
LNEVVVDLRRLFGSFADIVGCWNDSGREESKSRTSLSLVDASNLRDDFGEFPLNQVDSSNGIARTLGTCKLWTGSQSCRASLGGSSKIIEGNCL